MAQSGVSVAPECIQAFNDLKLGKSTKWIIYKISDDWKEIVVEESSTDPDYSKFREKLLNAKSKNKRGEEGIGGRYAVFDVEYDAEGGEGKRSKITFISWVPDDAPQYVSLTPPTCHVLVHGVRGCITDKRGSRA
jgi:cofilin